MIDTQLAIFDRVEHLHAASILNADVVDLDVLHRMIDQTCDDHREARVRIDNIYISDSHVLQTGKAHVEAVRTELPDGLSWLGGHDRAFRQLDAEFDLLQPDLSILIRMVNSIGGALSAMNRRQYSHHLPAEVITRLEAVVRETFGETALRTDTPVKPPSA
ncbi:hypothetical protein [Paraburkholderia sp. 32]|uniref:hypothetical protein n=1 Tax=Paraburkholderia sp. 32 TaxID=2991057 RepID=UPI003D214E19